MVMAFDRDGTVIGCLRDFEGNHPKHLKTPQCQKIIRPVAEWINKHGAILVSNQQGIAWGYTTIHRVVAEFLYEIRRENPIPLWVGMRGKSMTK